MFNINSLKKNEVKLTDNPTVNEKLKTHIFKNREVYTLKKSKEFTTNNTKEITNENPKEKRLDIFFNTHGYGNYQLILFLVLSLILHG